MNQQDDYNDTLDACRTWKKEIDLKEGSRIHRYQILGLIGKGGMGAVYQAYDPELDRSIAIKIMAFMPQVGETASKPHARLMREAQALAKLSHPNVVAVHDVGTFDEGVYIAMEYVKGKTLREWLQDKKPTRKEIVKFISNAGIGLQAAHREGIVHRDFKPENVIIGDRGQVKVLDFGLARAAGCEESSAVQAKPQTVDDTQSGGKLLSTPLTQAGAIIGTTVYMAPEHFFFQELDEKTDQFSFCVTLFEALYGQRPFCGKTVEELERKITEGLVEIPKTANVPRWIEDIIVKGLSVSKNDRYPSIADLLEALDHDPEALRAQKRKKHFLILAFVFAALLFLGIGYALFSQTDNLCTGADRKTATIWNDEQKTKIDQAFSRTGLSYSHDTFVRLEKQLDDHLAKWRRMYTETCEATRVRGEQSEEIMDLKMGCLNKHLRNVGALTKLFCEADKSIVQKAIQAASSFDNLAHCNETETLRSRIPLPKDKHTRNKVKAIRHKLADAKALRETGKFRESLELVKTIQTEAQDVDYRPLQAEVLYLRGVLFEKTGEYEKAEAVLNQSTQVAGECGEDLLAADGLAFLVRVVGFQLSRHEEALSIGRAAKVVLNLGGGDWRIQADLLNYLGIMYWKRKRDFDKAEEVFRNSLAIRKKRLGPNHPSLMYLLNNLSGLFMEQEDFQKAHQYQRRALKIQEQAFGLTHPDVALNLANIGIIFYRQGDHKKAIDYMQKALAIWEKAFGPEHPVLAWALSTIGNGFIKLGTPKKAQGPLRRVLSICEKKKCNPSPHARSNYGLAQVLVATSDDKQQAIVFAKKAQELFKQNATYFVDELKEVETWLNNQ